MTSCPFVTPVPTRRRPATPPDGALWCKTPAPWGLQTADEIIIARLRPPAYDNNSPTAEKGDYCFGVDFVRREVV